MKKNLKKKFMLNKHTVANLGVNEMRAIQGGVFTEQTCSLCFSGCNTEVPRFCGSGVPCTQTC